MQSCNCVTPCTTLHVLIQIFNPHQMSNGILADYCDGVQCRQHPLFGKDRHALQIFLYYDDAEVVNPLGSSATIHKLGKHTISCTYSVCLKVFVTLF